MDTISSLGYVASVMQVLHCVEQFEIIAKEKSLKQILWLQGLQGEEGTDTAQRCDAPPLFTIRNEYIYFASSLTCSWVIYCPGQREKRSVEQLHVNRLEMTQIPPDHWSRRDAAWACHQHPATIPYRPTVPFCLHLPSPALLHSSKATTTGRLIK